MAQDSHNIIPVTFAVLLHVIIFGSMFVAFDFNRVTPPPTPLAIKASIVTDDATLPPPPPPPVERQPEPEVEQPDPEPELQQADPEEEARIRAEDEKRQEDERIENARIEREKKAEEEEAERVAAEDKARQEREAEELREKLEREREENIRRQREENEQIQRDLEEQLRQDQIAEEEAMLAAQNSNEMQVYLNMIRQRVRRNWNRPGTARDDLECVVAVTQARGGEVLSATVTSDCNGDAFVRRSVENAVLTATPLPQPDNPLLFLRNFTITFTYNE